MNIETVLLIVIVTFACGFVLDRWNVRLSRSRRRQAVRPLLALDVESWLERASGKRLVCARDR